jgi:ATP-dependent exoDNAse (exonuclease V) alpha subunit
VLQAPEAVSNQPEVWVVDEAGLLSAKDALALVTRAQEQQARVILVGDTRQLSAVEAGNPFKSLQQAGMATAYLTQSLRQKNQQIKSGVDLIAEGKIAEGIHQLKPYIQQVESEERGPRRSPVTIWPWIRKSGRRPCCWRGRIESGDMTQLIRQG